MRVLEYVDEVKSGVLNASSRPELVRNNKNFLEINGNGGIEFRLLILLMMNVVKTLRTRVYLLWPLKMLGILGGLERMLKLLVRMGF